MEYKMKNIIKLAERILEIDPDAAESVTELVEYFMMHPSEIRALKEEYNVQHKRPRKMGKDKRSAQGKTYKRVFAKDI